MIDRFKEFSSTIASVYKAIQKIERDQMAPYGLKGPHVQCLVIMSRYPEGITAAELCELCEKDKAAISRAVSELEKEDLLVRDTDGDRIYRTPLKLTQKGMETAQSISGLAERAVTAAGSKVSDGDRAIFYQVLHQIADNLQKISEDGLE